MTVRAFDLILLPTMKGPHNLGLQVLYKTDTPEEGSDLLALANVRLGSKDLDPFSFSGPHEYLEAARKAVVNSIKHFTGQEEEIRPFSAQDAAVEVVNHLNDWTCDN